jgi:glycosidase
MSDDLREAVLNLLKCRGVEKENLNKSKQLRNHNEELKEKILQYMKSMDVSFVPFGESEYLVRKTKTQKPQMNMEFIRACLQVFLQKHSVPNVPALLEEFEQFVAASQAQLCTYKEDLVITSSKPVASLYCAN